jgi:hypothetical protein
MIKISVTNSNQQYIQISHPLLSKTHALPQQKYIILFPLPTQLLINNEVPKSLMQARKIFIHQGFRLPKHLSCSLSTWDSLKTLIS